MKYIKNSYNIKILNFENNVDIVDYIFDNKHHCRSINFVYFSNYVLLEKNMEYLKAMKNSDLVLIDGIGLQVYFKALNGSGVHNNHGTDLLPSIVNYCIKNNKDLAFYGASETSVQECHSKYKQHKNIYYSQDGYSDLEWNKIRGNSVLLVGLGTPNQELWQLEYQNILKEKNILVIGVGGFFDFCSGHYSRAPRIIIKLKVEWLYRLFKHPKQHFKKNVRNFYIFKYLLASIFKKAI